MPVPVPVPVPDEMFGPSGSSSPLWWDHGGVAVGVFLDQVERPAGGLVEDPGDVLAKSADGEQLNAGEEKDRCDHSRRSERHHSSQRESGTKQDVAHRKGG